MTLSGILLEFPFLDPHSTTEDLQLAGQPPLRAAAHQGPRIGENLVHFRDEGAPHQTSPDFDW